VTLELPGVVHVIRNQLHPPQKTRSWDYLGLSTHPPTNLLPKANRVMELIPVSLTQVFFPLNLHN